MSLTRAHLASSSTGRAAPLALPASSLKDLQPSSELNACKLHSSNEQPMERVSTTYKKNNNTGGRRKTGAWKNKNGDV